MTATSAPNTPLDVAAWCEGCGAALFDEGEGFAWQWIAARDGAPDGGLDPRAMAICQRCVDAAEDEERERALAEGWI